MSARIKLESVANPEAVEILQVESGVVTVGRERANSIVVDSTSISRRHGTVSDAGSQWVYRDLGSTNGSWVNGVQIKTGQIKLLRDGDVLQLADFPMRISEVSNGDHASSQEEGKNAPPSLLVFQGDKFHLEFPLSTPGARFIVGGSDGDFYLEGQPTDEVFLEIASHGGRLHLSTASGALPVVVNGMAVSGVTTLSDRDEIEINSYTIIANDTATSSPAEERANMVGAGTSPKDIKPVPAYDRPNVPEHIRQPPNTDGWESESARRKSISNRRFVFGAEPYDNEDDDLSQTSTHQSINVSGTRGFELSASHRFAGIMDEGEESGQNKISEKVLVIVGVLTFLIVLGFLGLFLLWFFSQN